MRKRIASFRFSLFLFYERIRGTFVQREPGYFEKKYRFKIGDKFLLKWSKIIPRPSDAFLYERYPRSRHVIRLPYHNGDITICRIGSMLEYRNWPYGFQRMVDDGVLRTTEENMLRGDSFKVIGRDEALRYINDCNFLRKVADCVPGIRGEIGRVVRDFGAGDLIVIEHTKHINSVFTPETAMQYT